MVVIVNAFCESRKARRALIGLIVLFAVGFACIALACAYGIASALQRPRRKTYGVALAWGLPTDPAHLSPDFSEQVFQFRDGTTTVVWDIPGQAEAGPVVVFLHGHADSRFGALTWLPLFHDLCSRVLVFDQRAHGDSTAKRTSGGLGEADDVHELLQSLLPGEKVVLYGASLGAGIALVAAARDQNSQVAGVVVDSVYRHRMEPVAATIRLSGYPAQPYVWLAEKMLRLTGRAAEPFDRLHHAREIRCPLLVLHGGVDRIAPPESARLIAEAAPDGAFHLFDDAGHVGAAAKDRERYRDALARFLGRTQTSVDAEADSDDSPQR